MARVGDFEILRQLYTGTYMANNGYDRETALARAKSGAVDLAAFYLEPGSGGVPEGGRSLGRRRSSYLLWRRRQRIH